MPENGYLPPSTETKGDSDQGTRAGIRAAGGPDPSGYQYADSNEPGGPVYNFEDISVAGNPINLGFAQMSKAIPIGFTFNFYDLDYSQLYVISQGSLTFLPSQNTTPFSVSIPDVSSPNGLIAGWWGHLFLPSGGTIHYQTLGITPNRRFIVQFTDVKVWFLPATFSTFQFKLFERTRMIEVHYQSARGNMSFPFAAGIENHNGTSGLEYYFGTFADLTTPLAVRYWPEKVEVNKNVDDPYPTQDQLITYTVTVANYRVTAVTGGVLSDTLPSGLTFAGPISLDPPAAGTVGSTPPILAYDLSIPSWGETITVTIPVTVNMGMPADTLIDNTAAFTSTEVITPVIGTTIIRVDPTQQATYLTAVDNENNALTGSPDGDMGGYGPPCIWRYDGIHPIEFNINVPQGLPIQEAVLLIYALDVDEEKGEWDDVYFNGNYAGRLAGGNNIWNTTSFVLDKNWVQAGNNLVQIYVDVGSTNDWCVNIGWGQLVIDSGFPDESEITRVDVDSQCYVYTETVDIDVEYLVDVSHGGNFRLETDLIISDSLNIRIDLHNFSAVDGQTINHTEMITFTNWPTRGVYTTYGYLLDDDTELLNDWDVATFEIADVCVPYDYGDAPDPTYPTMFSNDGARHILGSGLYLGGSVDAEGNGQPDATATGDNLDGSDDEDGVTFASPLAQCMPDAPITVTASAPGLLDAWVVFNSDGDWADAGEQIFTSEALASGDNALTFDVPCGAASARQTFLRFRFSSAGGLSFTGAAADGEVEDYAVEIKERYQATFYSIAREDGQILESSEDSGTGGRVNSKGKVMRVGDDGSDKQYRSFLSFNTSSLPDDAVLMTATLAVREYKITGAPYGSLGSLLVDMRSRRFGRSPRLEAADFNAKANLMPAFELYTSVKSSWLSAGLPSTARENVNLLGRTQFRLRFELDDDDDGLYDYVNFFTSNDKQQNHWPFLKVYYYLP